MDVSKLNERAKFFAKLIWNKDLDIDLVIDYEMNELSNLIINENVNGTTKSFITINRKIPYCIDSCAINNIILYELCRWFMYLDSKDCYDGDDEFESELERRCITSINRLKLMSEDMYCINGNNLYSLYIPTQLMLSYEKAFTSYINSKIRNK